MALLCFVISFLMFITGIISEKISNPIPQWLYILIGIIEVSACVILMGGLWYQWFPMSIKWILEIIVIDLIIYFAVYGITFFQERQFANNINKIIKTGGKTMEKIIEVKNLKKSYGNVQAVKSLSFYVESGKLFAFLGPNGAGKSTTIDIITTFLKPDSGEVIVCGRKLGHEDDKIRSQIGAVFQDGVLDQMLTIKENIMIRGGFYGLSGDKLRENVEKAMAVTGVTEIQNRRYGKLSGGQRRRADIARALVNTPKILFLDEPTTGLDPQTRKSVWETIRKLQEETKMTVFLTTHYMEEAAEADYVVVIDGGEISAKGTPVELKEKYAGDILIISPKKNNTGAKEYLQNNKLAFAEVGADIKINIKSTMDSLPILDACRDYIDGFEVLNGTMDDAFIAITGKEIRE